MANRSDNNNSNGKKDKMDNKILRCSFCNK